MTLIKVKNKQVATLPFLLRLVLKHIFEPQNMSLAEEEAMQKSFVDWNKKVDKTEDEEYYLVRMAKLLKRNETGGLERLKRLLKEWNIDYKRYYRLPEARIGVYTKKYLAELERIKEDHILRYG